MALDPDQAQPLAQPEPSLAVPEPAFTPDEPAYRRLRDADKAKILRLDSEGLTQTVIAQQLGTSQNTVSRVLREFAGTQALAKRFAEAQSLSIVTSLAGWTKTRDKVGLDAAKTVLNVAGLTERNQVGQPSVQVIVGLSLPGTVGYQANQPEGAKVLEGSLHNKTITGQVVSSQQVGTK